MRAWLFSSTLLLSSLLSGAVTTGCFSPRVTCSEAGACPSGDLCDLSERVCKPAADCPGCNQPFALAARQVSQAANPKDEFGFTVAMGPSTAVVGAFGDNADTGGAAYIYERKQGAWTLSTSEISPDAAALGNQYGRAVAATTDVVVVGAPLAAPAAVPGAGSAYIYERVADVWQAVVPSLTGTTVNEGVGCAVAARGNVLAVTSCVAGVAGNGVVNVYERIDNVWQLVTNIPTATGVTAGDRFGATLAVGNGVIVVGAPEDKGKGGSAGAVYLFEKDGTGIWQQTAKLLASDGAPGDLFGSAVAADGDTIVVGASRSDVRGTNAGAVYIFERDGTTWPEAGKLLASDAQAVDFFGFALAISGEQIVVGARWNDDVGEDSGSAYLFERIAGNWVEFGRMVAPDGKAGDGLGYGVAIDQGVLAATAYPESMAGNSGALYIFERPAR